MQQRQPLQARGLTPVFVLLVKLTPPISLAIPLYQVLRALALLDTLAGLIIVYQVYTLPFAIWMLLGFVRDVPVEYEEAALVDGASLPRRLAVIVIPVMMPGIIATAVFVMILSWNEFIYALLFIQSPFEVHATHLHRDADHRRRDLLGQAFGHRVHGFAADPISRGVCSEGADERFRRRPEVDSTAALRLRPDDADRPSEVTRPIMEARSFLFYKQS